VQSFIYSEDKQVDKGKTDGRGCLKKRDSLDYLGIKCEDIVKTEIKRHDGMLCRRAPAQQTDMPPYRTSTENHTL
jgi:hypothetical protein